MEVCKKRNFSLSPSEDMDLTSPLFLSAVILLSFLILSLLGRMRNTRRSHGLNEQARSAPWTTLTNLLVVLCIIVLLTLVVDCGVITAQSLNDKVWTSTLLAYYVGGLFAAWVLCLLTLVDELHKFGRIYWTHSNFWLMALATETSVGWLWIETIKHLVPGSSWTFYDQVLFGSFISRYLTHWTLMILSVVHLFSESSTLAETSPLLNTNETTSDSGYNATASDSTLLINTKEPDTFSTDFYKNIGELMPFIWPQNNWRMQFFVVLCFGLMLLGLFVNACIPYQMGSVVDHFGKGTFAWSAVLIYVGLKFLQGGSGLIQWVQNLCWISVNQYTTHIISLKLFEHLLLLSLSYHLSRKTGQVLRVMDRGVTSVSLFLFQVLFQILPAIANILIAVVLISVTFSLVYGAIVFVTMVLYLYVTITVSKKRIKLWRTTTELDNSTRAYALDSLINFETVKYCGNSVYEVDRYNDAFVEYQKAYWKSSMSLTVISLAQHVIITAGVFVGCILLAYEISLGRLTSGDFVIFNMYMMQLYSPLQLFGNYYRLMQVSFVDMEKMLDLLKKQQTVEDIPDAPDIIIKEGTVQFDNVAFTYDNRQTALKGVSFTVSAGSTVALVGPTGSGKSTILRLLFRFYDPTSGSIFIDGQNIRNIKQSSLRRNIGVVPQDCVLFNDTILYNLQYGNIHASIEEVYEAAKAAQIHDKILTFPDGYNTLVGERGLRLSTGEKQRMAIGRAILKNSPIILLDEATSSLDTLTERHLQQALNNATQDRTTIAIAHRLSTIVNADLILVIKDGLVVESGTHEELIKQGDSRNTTDQSIYRDMWQKQQHEVNGDEAPFTFGKKSARASDMDGIVLTENDRPYVANKPDDRPTTETYKTSQDHQQQHDTTTDLVAVTQRVENRDNSDTNGIQDNREDHPSLLLHLDILSQLNQPGFLSSDDQEETVASSPVKLDNPQDDNNESVSSPAIARNSENLQQAANKVTKNRSKGKSKRKSKKQKKKSSRNNTTFS